jgi:predicted DsbA family dithiol-disulfide isomerase
MRAHYYTIETEPKREHVLPEDQQRTREVISEIAAKYGLEVQVIDVSRENILHRAIQEERKKIRTFPTLVAETGERIEGQITEEQAKSFLARISDRARKKYL